VKSGKRLSIGIRDNEFRTIQVLRDHIVDGISAAATYADDGDFGFQFNNILGVCHGRPLVLFTNSLLNLSP